MTYKPYPAYKDSGVEWLGEIPNHWDSLRLKNVVDLSLSNIDKHSVKGEQQVLLCNYLDVYNNERIHPEIDFMPATASNEQIRRLSLKPGDVIITKDSESPNDIGVPTYVVGISPNLVCGYHLAVLRPKGKFLSGDFLFRYLQSENAKAIFSVKAKGITRFALGKNEISCSSILAPPATEQQAITTFLDEKVCYINILIEKKQRQIELLQEKRSALITHAVTKGLDPEVKMKDSKIPWLDTVPKHWKEVPLKLCLKNRSDAIKTGPFGSQLLSSEMLGGPVKVINQRNVIDCDFSSGDNYINWEKFLDLKAFKISQGDILISTRGTIGRCAIFPEEAGICILHPCLMRVQPNPKILEPEYLAFLIQDSAIILTQLKILSNATTIDVIYSESLKSTTLPLPPISEQKEILSLMREKAKQYEKIISRIQHCIISLHEYRLALITAAVTGKIDVRESVA